ncbi:MAG: NAD-glutamate dehydrogenase [Gammaproteobacteria bacterium]|nr:NAD-glutamate dehydrogenase [Gammaproteobacteria bacterium]
MSISKNSQPREALAAWSQKNRDYIKALERKAASLKQEAMVDYSMLSVIVAELESIK